MEIKPRSEPYGWVGVCMEIKGLTGVHGEDMGSSRFLELFV